MTGKITTSHPLYKTYGEFLPIELRKAIEAYTKYGVDGKNMSGKGSITPPALRNKMGKTVNAVMGTSVNYPIKPSVGLYVPEKTVSGVMKK